MRHPAVLAVSFSLLALTVVLLCGSADEAPASRPANRSGAWERWRSMDDSQRWSLARLYQQVARRDDAAAVLARARAFAALPDEAKEHFRQLHRLMLEMMRALPASQRAALRSAPPEARALQVYLVLKTQSPEKLASSRPGGDP